MRTLEAILDAIEAEAVREEFPIDEAVYRTAGKSPTRPILLAGVPEAAIGVMGRELGRQEVIRGEPLIGPAGKLVRRGFAEAFDADQDGPFDLALLTNTVPYKPPGNKAYSESVKARFRPFVAELLADHWSGTDLITLGTEAFRWFEPYAAEGALDELWARENRYELALSCTLPAAEGSPTGPKAIRVHPLPHPSPLNRRYYAAFPEMLAARLREIAGSNRDA